MGEKRSLNKICLVSTTQPWTTRNFNIEGKLIGMIKTKSNQEKENAIPSHLKSQQSYQAPQNGPEQEP